MESLPRVETRHVGRFRIHALQTGIQRLDGGAMFGVVPKPLWQRRIHPDDRNRILLGMRCVLIEHPNGLVLFDTGLGNKEDAKFREIYGVDNQGEEGRTWLEDAIASLGHTTGDVRWVINTHLHFDHAGGNTWRDDSGTVHPTFANATYVVQRGELDWATHTNERTAASYMVANWAAVVAAGRVELLDGDGGGGREILPGIRCRLTPGHTPYHQSLLLDGGGGDVACFLGDVCPTAAHVPLPWIMGYDVEPLRTLESKRALWKDAREQGWLLIFEHDAAVAWGRLGEDGKSIV
jgi:glyoxylase-like metal-dependent hydrolase (beta-lactamase superfamily II)